MIVNRLCLNNSHHHHLSLSWNTMIFSGKPEVIENRKLYAEWRDVYHDGCELFGNGLYRCIDIATLRSIKLVLKKSMQDKGFSYTNLDG